METHMDLTPIAVSADFPWSGGMLWYVDGGECPLCRGAGGFRWHEADGSENGETCPCSGRVPDWTPTPWEPRGAVPDPTDGATRGALLDAVRVAYGALVSVRPYEHIALPGGVKWIIMVGNQQPGIEGRTEFSALLAAWDARPKT